MKNKILLKSEEQDVFTDLLFNALLGFAPGLVKVRTPHNAAAACALSGHATACPIAV